MHFQEFGKLVLPASALPQPDSHEMARGYFTLKDLTGNVSTTPELFQLLGTIRRSELIGWVSTIMEAVSQYHDTKAQMELAHLLLEPELFDLLRSKSGGEQDWAIFHKRQLWLLLQLAALGCREDVPAGEGEGLRHKVGKACLMASDLLRQVESQHTTLPESPEDNLKWLITVLISHVISNTTHDLLARAYCFWFESLSDPTVKAEFDRLGIATDFEELFQRAYGLSLHEFFFIAISFCFNFLKSAARPISAGVLDTSVDSGGLMSDADKEAALKLLSIHVDQMPAHLLGTPRQSWALDASPLMAKPLLQVLPNKYACPDLSHYRSFFVDGLFWLLNDASGTPEWRKFFGKIYEWYINRLIGAFTVSSGPLARNFFVSPKFQGTEDQACDGLILWERVALLCEYKGSRFTPRQRSGVQMEDTIKAIEDLVGSDKIGIGQLARNLKRILAGETIVVGTEKPDVGACKQILPVLIWYEESGSNHAVRNFLQEKLTARLTQLGVDTSRVGPLLLFTTRDIETLQWLTRKVSAEQLILDYADFLLRFPRDPATIFHVYAHRKFEGQKLPPSWVAEKTIEVLKGIAAIHESRVSSPQDASSGR